jgi:hypothetical protein
MPSFLTVQQKMDVDELLQAYARNVAFEMGKNTTTSTTELNDYGKRHFSPMQFLGVHPANQTPARTKERCFYIQNVDDSSKPGPTGWRSRGSPASETCCLTRLRGAHPQPLSLTCAAWH